MGHGVAISQPRVLLQAGKPPTPSPTTRYGHHRPLAGWGRDLTTGKSPFNCPSPLVEPALFDCPFPFFVLWRGTMARVSCRGPLTDQLLLLHNGSKSNQASREHSATQFHSHWRDLKESQEIEAGDGGREGGQSVLYSTAEGQKPGTDLSQCAALPAVSRGPSKRPEALVCPRHGRGRASVCNPSTQEAQVGGSQVWSQLTFHSLKLG